MPSGRATACAAWMCMLLAALFCEAELAEIHKKWIIVTTINYPTESIRILANMTDWKVNHLSDSVVYYIVH